MRSQASSICCWRWRAAVGIARQIGQSHGLWPAERAPASDHPCSTRAQWGEIRGERLCVSEGDETGSPKILQVAGFVGRDQLLQEQSAEQARRHAHRQEEAEACTPPG